MFSTVAMTIASSALAIAALSAPDIPSSVHHLRTAVALTIGAAAVLLELLLSRSVL
ncbi:MAG: hypothetical protein OSB43_17875 [Nocardioides sp.]|uniref:hypothetical protein n=1 Tax=Nocardioides sp. TaxID=35761 RepID=UPI002396E4BC|nr:hypothetical protein [Nocardioides sp.]MDE0778152.1 hypothetical protein [Nocardioides sp.]